MVARVAREIFLTPFMSPANHITIIGSKKVQDSVIERALQKHNEHIDQQLQGRVRVRNAGS
jgi:hypothetical protein